MQVERKSGIAIWRQIADAMRQAIADGEFDATGRMPPEFALAERFGVNRHTVRAAIATLVDEGLLESIRGSGTLVKRRRRFTFPISRRTRFSTGLADQAQALEIALVREETVEASSPIAQALHIAEGAPLVRLTLRSMADGWPVSTSINHFSAARFGAIGDRFRETASVTKAFARLGIADYVRLFTELSARLADEGEREVLGLRPGAVVMEAVSVNGTPDGTPIQHALTVFAADRVNLRLGEGL